MSTSLLGSDYVAIQERSSTPALIAGKGQLRFDTTTHNLYYVDGNTGAEHLVATGVLLAAPNDATYWTSSANATLTNEVNTGALGNGMLKVTSGTPSIAVPGTDYLTPAEIDQDAIVWAIALG